jgi:hypothetical protein
MFLFASIILLKVIIIYCILKCIIRAVRKCIDNTTKNNNHNQNLSYSNETQVSTNHNKLLSIGERFTKFFKYHRKRHENNNLDDIELRELNANLINQTEDELPKTSQQDIKHQEQIIDTIKSLKNDLNNLKLTIKNQQLKLEDQ